MPSLKAVAGNQSGVRSGTARVGPLRLLSVTYSQEKIPAFLLSGSRVHSRFACFEEARQEVDGRGDAAHFQPCSKPATSTGFLP